MKRLTHNVRVLVIDGARALVMRNVGEVGRPDLQLVKSYGQEEASAHEKGSGKPPARINESTSHQASVKTADPRQQDEDRFVAQVVADMEAGLRAGEYTELIVVAPPVALGVFRKEAPAAVTKATVMEINKDLTRHKTAEIAAIVVKALEAA